MVTLWLQLEGCIISVNVPTQQSKRACCVFACLSALILDNTVYATGLYGAFKGAGKCNCYTNIIL